MSFKVLAPILISLVLAMASTAAKAEASAETRAWFSQLAASLSAAQAEIKSLRSSSQSCVRYSFRLTHEKGNFDAARQMCRDLGGDLIHESLLPSGIEYHNQIREMMSGAKTIAWVGLKDHVVEGDWRLLNGERFDPNDRSQPSLYFWVGNEPNSSWGNHEDCAAVGRVDNGIANDEGLYDYSCETDDHLGLCEMKHDTCL